ncbi:MAG TPA: hypothetical protein VEC37_14595, partial [Bacillota bacterium]|nr:hypothetical protein [Bacillota bacterium]
MKRALYAFLGIISLASCLLYAVPAMGVESNWDVSIKQSWVDGNADFWVYYPHPNPNVISQLHAPQKQWVTLLETKYTFTNAKESYLKFGYGSTESGNKGRGFDADWANPDDYNQISDYGTMDFYGEQTNLSIDFGFKIFESNLSKTNAFMGWTRHKTTNELRNVIYYLYDSTYLIPPIAQADIGAFYNMDFKGYRIGLEHTQQFGPKLSLTGIASLGYIETNLYGEWTNHSPKWMFNDS